MPQIISQSPTVAYLVDFAVWVIASMSFKLNLYLAEMPMHYIPTFLYLSIIFWVTA